MYVFIYAHTCSSLCEGVYLDIHIHTHVHTHTCKLGRNCLELEAFKNRTTGTGRRSTSEFAELYHKDSCMLGRMRCIMNVGVWITQA